MRGEGKKDEEGKGGSGSNAKRGIGIKRGEERKKGGGKEGKREGRKMKRERGSGSSARRGIGIKREERREGRNREER